MTSSRWKIGGILLISVAATYAGSYLLLSLMGGYRDNISVLNDFGTPCFCASSWEQWQPALIQAAYFPSGPNQSPTLVADGLGHLYLPLVYLDQKFWHKTLRNAVGKHP